MHNRLTDQRTELEARLSEQQTAADAKLAEQVILNISSNIHKLFITLVPKVCSYSLAQ